MISSFSAPTQSISNGERADNSDESGSMRGGYSSGPERSRDHSRERSRDRSRDRSRERTAAEEPLYGVIQTQPRARSGRRSVPRRHTVGGSTLNGPAAEQEVSFVLLSYNTLFILHTLLASVVC